MNTPISPNVQSILSEKGIKIESFYIRPTASELLMWLYEKRKVWISVDFDTNKSNWTAKITDTIICGYDLIGDFDSPLQAYDFAIQLALKTFIPSSIKQD